MTLGLTHSPENRTPVDISKHEGRKYLRQIYSATEPGSSVWVDVYEVLVAFGVTCPARQHCIKKLLCCGNRNKGDEMADLIGAMAALNRAIDLQRRVTDVESGSD